MAWSDTLPGIAQAVVPGWFNTAPDAPKPTVTGWWAGLDIDGTLSVQFVTEAELRILKNMGAVLAVNVNRSLVLQAIRMLALNRGLTVTMNLGLQGVYFLDANMPIGVNRALSLSKVWAMNFASNITFSPSMALGKLIALGAMNQLWTVNTSAGLTHIVPLNGSQTWNVNLSDSIVAIHTLDFTRSVAANLVADLTVIPFKKSFQDTFNRANTAVSGLLGNASDGSGAWLNMYKSSTNYLHIQTNGAAPGSALQMAVHRFPQDLVTADQEVVVTIGSGTYSNIQQLILCLRSDATKIGTYVIIPWGSTTQIKTHTSWTIGSGGASGTSRGSTSFSPTSVTAGWKWRFRAVGDQYTCDLLNASDVVQGTYATWNDSGQLSSRTGRSVGFGLNASSTSVVLVDQFDAKDI